MTVEDEIIFAEAIISEYPEIPSAEDVSRAVAPYTDNSSDFYSKLMSAYSYVNDGIAIAEKDMMKLTELVTESNLGYDLESIISNAKFPDDYDVPKEYTQKEIYRTFLTGGNYREALRKRFGILIGLIWDEVCH